MVQPGVCNQLISWESFRLAQRQPGTFPPGHRADAHGLSLMSQYWGLTQGRGQKSSCVLGLLPLAFNFRTCCTQAFYRCLKTNTDGAP